MAHVEERAQWAMADVCSSDDGDCAVVKLSHLLRKPSVSARHVGERPYDPATAIGEFLFHFCARALAHVPNATETTNHVKRVHFQ